MLDIQLLIWLHLVKYTDIIESSTLDNYNTLKHISICFFIDPGTIVFTKEYRQIHPTLIGFRIGFKRRRARYNTGFVLGNYYINRVKATSNLVI
jgi:hypothetical protein